jgi:putative ABC transport system substrate-binding protein
MIGRRGILGGGISVLASRALGQASDRIYRIGSIHIARRDAPQHRAFLEEMARLGFAEGRNLEIDEHGYGLRPDRFRAHAVALAQARVDAIYVGGDAGVAAAADATRTIPILGVVDDLVGTGYALSLAKPGRNVTGFSVLAALLDGKRQELLSELMPRTKHLAALGDRRVVRPEAMAALQQASAARGVTLDILLVTEADEIRPAVERAKALGAEGINVLATPLLFNNEHIVIEAARQLGLATMHQWPDSARKGGLAGYGPNMPQIYRTHVARIMARLLAGANPADIPIEQPTRLEMVLNRATANALGLELPASMLARADEVIE